MVSVLIIYIPTGGVQTQNQYSGLTQAAALALVDAAAAGGKLMRVEWKQF